MKMLASAFTKVYFHEVCKQKTKGTHCNAYIVATAVFNKNLSKQNTIVVRSHENLQEGEFNILSSVCLTRDRKCAQCLLLSLSLA